MDVEQESLFAKYKNSGFTKEQLAEIKKGIEQELDITLYSRTGIPVEEMAYIRKLLFLKKEEETCEVPEENPEDVEAEYESYKESVQVAVYEKIVAFAIMIGGLAVIVAFFAMLMSWPLIK